MAWNALSRRFRFEKTLPSACETNISEVLTKDMDQQVQSALARARDELSPIHLG